MKKGTPDVTRRLHEAPRRWLVTGAAGFIGAHLTRFLLQNGQTVTGLDNFSGGKRTVPDTLRRDLAPEDARRLTFLEGDIRDQDTCRKACHGIDFVLHHAAIGSVPRSLEDPVLTEQVNMGGFVTLLQAASMEKVQRFLYASSSAVYGDGTNTPRREDESPSPLSPYAVTKHANELYANILGDHMGLQTTGFRYFNIYGPGQDPQGPYAAVIPRWIDALRTGKPIQIHGDGETVRDFCYVEDVVQANILAALSDPPPDHPVYNIASGRGTTLNELIATLKKIHRSADQAGPDCPVIYTSPRPLDIRVSLADISRAHNDLGYAPGFNMEEGLIRTLRAPERRAAA